MRHSSARWWSNGILLAMCPSLENVGSVINVSGWNDSDKEGRSYKDYFPQADRYFISNYPDDRQKGLTEASDVPLDLEKELPDSLVEAFDLVFSHTVLEHIRHPEQAFKKMCSMSRQYIVTVVPFVQGFHYSHGNFGDYFRFTPMLMRRIHSDNGFSTVYENWGPRYGTDVYLVTVGCRTEYVGDFRIADLESMNEIAGAKSLGILALTVLNLSFIKSSGWLSRVFR